MDHLGTLSAFVQAAETGSFVAAGRKIGLSSSAVGKAVNRLELRLGVRLFHRDTRNMTLTEEGRLFLDRCRRIFEEIDAAEMELAKTAVIPSGRLRISLPLGGIFLMPTVGDFMHEFPTIVVDLDFSDRLVDVIEEGFDVVIRTGIQNDSRLMRRSLGRFSGLLVASPAYVARHGHPTTPQDLVGHACLRQRSSVTGKLNEWPLRTGPTSLPETMSANTIAPLIELALRGLGIAFLPPFAVDTKVREGSLVPLLADYVLETGELSALWSTSRQLSPRIRAFIEFMAERIPKTLAVEV